MLNRERIANKRAQSDRLSQQHLATRGVEGIFGEEARRHDGSIKPVTRATVEKLKEEFPELEFRTRSTLRKSEIHEKLRAIDPRLGQSLFVQTASIQPDGGITDAKDRNNQWRTILVGECKFQGKELQNIPIGMRTADVESLVIIADDLAG